MGVKMLTLAKNVFIKWTFRLQTVAFFSKRWIFNMPGYKPYIFNLVLHGIVLFLLLCILLYCIVLYCVLFVVLYSIVLHYIVWYCIVYSSYAMFSSAIPWNMPRVTCIFRIHTSLLYGDSFRKCMHAVTQFWRHFDSRSQVMAGKPGGILPVEYYALDTAKICNGFPGLLLTVFLRHDLKSLVFTVYHTSLLWIATLSHLSSEKTNATECARLNVLPQQ